MTKLMQEECRNLVVEYHTCTEEKRDSSSVRNDLFTKMLPYLMRWVKAFLSKRGKFVQNSEILSLAWDGFMFALDKYKNLDIPLPSHFHTYVNFYLMGNASDYADKLGAVELLDEHVSDLEMSFPVIGAIEFLSMYRNSLNDTYKMIFDDAASGNMTNYSNDKIQMKGQKQKYIPFYRYNEAKVVFRSLIEFFLLKC